MLNPPHYRTIWLIAALTALVITACGPAAPTEEIFVVVTSTTPQPTLLTPTPPPLLASVAPITPTPPAGIVQPPDQLPTATPPSASGASCDGAPAARLSVGSTGRVTITNGLPVNVRESAGIGMQQVGAMDEGTEFAVVNGPVCANSMWWWNIDVATGIGGWAAEGDASGYFLEPYP